MSTTDKQIWIHQDFNSPNVDLDNNWICRATPSFWVNSQTLVLTKGPDQAYQDSVSARSTEMMSLIYLKSERRTLASTEVLQTLIKYHHEVGERTH